MPENDPAQQGSAAISILLVEDNPGDARLIREMLKDTAGWQLLHVETLAAALQALRQGGAAAVLLDLNLPDSSGIGTVEKIVAVALGIPVVVLTGQADENTGLDALQRFAQDYLTKDELNPALLTRSLRYAMERARLLASVEEARAREMQVRELRELERLTHETGLAAGVTASLYGRQPLRQCNGALFQELAATHRALLDRAVEMHLYRVENAGGGTVQAFAARLGFLYAGPQDLIDIHTETLKELTGSPRHQAYVVEGRMLLLELMGRLAGYYRNYAQGGRRG